MTVSVPRRPGPILIAMVLAASLLVTPAAAHPVGTCPVDNTADRCESWSAIHHDTEVSAPHRSDEFATSVSTSQTTVFTTLREVAIDLANPYDSSAEWVVLAHDSNSGELAWSAVRRTRHYDQPLASAVTSDGRLLLVTGSAYNGYPVGGATDAHIVTVAYDAATGDELWSRVWDNRPDATDAGKSIVVSPNGKTVVIGGVTMMPSGDLDYVTLAYDVDTGDLLWSQTAAGLREKTTDSLNDIAMSPHGDFVYVTGEAAGVAEFDADFLTIAYGVRSGITLWTARYAGMDQGWSERANAIAVAPDGSRVYVTGDSWGGSNAGTTQYDYATVAYDARTGTQDWVSRWGGPTPGFNAPIGVVAADDRVIVTGQSRGESALDVRDYGTVAYDAASGEQVWSQLYAPPLHDEIALDLALSPDGSTAFVTGASSPTVQYTDLDEVATVAYAVSDGAEQWTSRLDVGFGNAALGRRATATADGGVAVIGQTTYSANPLQPQSQNIYDTLIVKY